MATSTPMKAESPILSGPPLNIPDLGTGLGTRFYNSLEKFKEKIHQVDSSSGATETKSSVKERSIKVAIELQKHGVVANNVVIISSKIHMDITVTVLGCLFVGAIVAPLDQDYSSEEMKVYVKILQPKFAFCGNRSARLLNRILKEENIACPVYVYNSDSRDFDSFEKCLENEIKPQFTVATILDPKTTVAFISYTQGTESDEKLVSITHNAMAMRYIPVMNLAIKKNEKVISTFPLSNFLQILVMCICFDSPAKLIILGPVSERGICKVIYELQVENLFIDADSAVTICKNAPVLDFDLSCLKIIFLANAVTTGNYIRVVKTFKKTIVATDYSTVETGMVAFATQDTFLKHRDKINSIGHLCPGVSVKTRPPQGGVAPPGWEELYVKSPALMSSYFNNHVPNKINRGFLRTGDLAKVDSDGFVFIRGRLKDEIMKENQVFTTLEIDNTIQAHPDVLESATTGNEFGDLVSYVVRKPGRDVPQDALIQYFYICYGSQVISGVLPAFKLPTKIIFRDSLPKTQLGCVKKYKLVETSTTLIREESFYADVDS